MSGGAVHTPGPWKLGRTSCYETALLASDGTYVAFAAWDGGSGCHLEIQNDADARLIASAPTLKAQADALATALEIMWEAGFDLDLIELARAEARKALSAYRGDPAPLASAEGV